MMITDDLSGRTPLARTSWAGRPEIVVVCSCRGGYQLIAEFVAMSPSRYTGTIKSF
jgi:hypothetical protein